MMTADAVSAGTAGPPQLPGRRCLVGFTRGFPGEAAQVARVRAAVSRLLDGCSAAGDVVLIASELAANAVVHTRSGAPGGQFTVRAGACPGRHVWVAVQDEGGQWAGRDDDGRPHGLELTAALARDWGVGGGADRGRTVWAVLAWAGDDAAPAASHEGQVPLCPDLPRWLFVGRQGRPVSSAAQRPGRNPVSGASPDVAGGIAALATCVNAAGPARCGLTLRAAVFTGPAIEEDA